MSNTSWGSVSVAGLILLVSCADMSRPPGRLGNDAVAEDHSAESVDHSGGQALDLKLDTPVRFADLEVVWVRVNDSRCAVGVTCVWEGEARIELEVSSASAAGPRIQIELALRGGVATESGSAFGHSFTLSSLEPYPHEGVTIERHHMVARIAVHPASSREENI